MFKRFSTNYMALLFIVDGLILQIALWAAIELRYIVQLGQAVQPDLVRRYAYAPGLELHILVGALWLISFLSFNVYTPRRIIYWYVEAQRIFLAHTISALSLAGLLYLANLELLRLTYAYFYVIALVLLLGYRLVLRLYPRFRRHTVGSLARILVVGAGKVGCDTIAEFQHNQWPGIDFVGFLDDDPAKQGKRVEGLPVLGTLNAAIAIIDAHQVDEVLVALKG